MADGPPRRELVEVLADFLDDAATLERHGDRDKADTLRRVCTAVREAAVDFLVWLSEKDALVKSGWSERTLRRRFAELQECGLARWKDGERQFLAVAIPPRVHPGDQRQRGAQMAVKR